MTEPMTHTDNIWLCMDDPAHLMVITGFMAFDEILDFQRVCATLRHRLLFLDRFRKRVVISSRGVPEWERDMLFDIRSHLHRVALPAEGDRNALQEMISDLMGVPLDQSKPLWQVHLIENYEKGCALFFRIHHCMGDGMALIRVLLSMADTVPDAPWPAPEPEKAKQPPSLLSGIPFGTLIESMGKTAGRTWKLGKNLAYKAKETAFNPFHLIELTRTGAGMTMDTAAAMTGLAFPRPHPPTPFMGNLGIRKCAAWTEPISPMNIRTARGVMETRLNDVLIATITAALRRYLQKRDDMPPELLVTVPVNIRKPGTEFELGNMFSLVWLGLPLHIEDPVLRLSAVRERMETLRDASDAFAGFSNLIRLGISPAKVAKKADDFFTSKSAAVLTHIPGPRQPLWFCGKKIRNMMFWEPGTGRIGLSISILSYDGRVTVGLVTDAGLVPDPETILEGFEEDFHYHSDFVKSGESP